MRSRAPIKGRLKREIAAAVLASAIARVGAEQFAETAARRLAAMRPTAACLRKDCKGERFYRGYCEAHA